MATQLLTGKNTLTQDQKVVFLMLTHIPERLVAFLEDIHTLSAQVLNILQFKHLNKYFVNDMSILIKPPSTSFRDKWVKV